MIFSVHYKGQDYTLDSDRGIDLSIPNNFDGKNPSFYGAKSPDIKPVLSVDFIGDVNKGGSCNVPVARVDIHCSGTHTECEGHINNSGLRISDVCPRGFLFSQIISIEPVLKSETNESYHVDCENELVISSESIRNNLHEDIEALILRTLPNTDEKLSRNYDENPAPFLTNDAIDFISKKGIQHVLVDVPSIDRANDVGKLGNHHRFFEYGKTISELLYIPDSIQDGLGFLQIQIPNWGLDAAPSRPIFYSVIL